MINGVDSTPTLIGLNAGRHWIRGLSQTIGTNTRRKVLLQTHK